MQSSPYAWGCFCGRIPACSLKTVVYEDHKSIPANHLLAEPMHYKGYIDKAGTGTENIVSKCLAYGLTTPLFQQDEDFRVVLYRTEAAIRDQVTPLGASEGPS